MDAFKAQAAKAFQERDIPIAEEFIDDWGKTILDAIRKGDTDICIEFTTDRRIKYVNRKQFCTSLGQAHSRIKKVTIEKSNEQDESSGDVTWDVRITF